MRTAVVWVSLVLASACESPAGPLRPGDPRVGEFYGAIEGCGTPGAATLQIWQGNHCYLDTALNGSIQSGSEPGVMADSAPQVRFEYVRNSMGDLTSYKLDATLSDDAQIVRGTARVAQRKFGEEAFGPEFSCTIAVRRRDSDPLFVQTSPGDFTCLLSDTFASMQHNPRAPVPTCFTSSELRAFSFRAPRGARYTFRGRDLYAVDVDDSRPLAVFTACDGRQLACVHREGTFPVAALTVQLSQFQDVVLVLGEPGEGIVEEVRY